jgi:flagellar hook-associated protein 3 FlgL
VGGGTTAAELGILAESELDPPTLASSDFNPRLTLTTPLDDLPAFDRASGLQVVNGGQTHTISLASAVTVEDLLNTFNGAGAGLLAEINSTGTGINVRSRISGADFSIGENGGSTASDLGLRTFTRQTRLDHLNHGLGVHTREGDDFQIRLKDGTLLSFDVSGAETIGDVMDLVNTAGGGQVTARLSPVGNGLELMTTDTSTTASFAVLKVQGSQAAEDLGLIPKGAQSSDPATASGGAEAISGRDVAPLEVAGVFTSLARLSDALRSNDLLGIERALGVLDASVLELNFARAELGARQQGLDLLSVRLEDEKISLESTLSLEIDADFVDVVSQLTARQAAFEASLELIGRTFQLTLLDYL